jgi:hypothetical protein
MCLAVDVFMVGATASLWLAVVMTSFIHDTFTHVVVMQDAHMFPFAWKGKFVLHKLQGQFATVFTLFMVYLVLFVS